MTKANELIDHVIATVRAEEQLSAWIGNTLQLANERRWRALQLATAKQELIDHITGLQSQLDEAANQVAELGDRLIFGDEDDPSPWCSYGHKTEASCDCGPIAENE